MKSCLVLDLLPPALQLAAGLGVPNARQQRLNRNKTVLKRRSSRQHASLRLLRTSVAGAAGAGAGTAPTSFSAAAKALEARLRQCVDAEAEVRIPRCCASARMSLITKQSKAPRSPRWPMSSER